MERDAFSGSGKSTNNNQSFFVGHYLKVPRPTLFDGVAGARPGGAKSKLLRTTHYAAEFMLSRQQRLVKFAAVVCAM
jgi:hypothetical protein